MSRKARRRPSWKKDRLPPEAFVRANRLFQLLTDPSARGKRIVYGQSGWTVMELDLSDQAPG